MLETQGQRTGETPEEAEVEKTQEAKPQFYPSFDEQMRMAALQSRREWDAAANVLRARRELRGDGDDKDE